MVNASGYFKLQALLHCSCWVFERALSTLSQLYSFAKYVNAKRLPMEENAKLDCLWMLLGQYTVAVFYFALYVPVQPHYIFLCLDHAHVSVERFTVAFKNV